jgi:hypothetical protein
MQTSIDIHDFYFHVLVHFCLSVYHCCNSIIEEFTVGNTEPRRLCLCNFLFVSFISFLLFIITRALTRWFSGNDVDLYSEGARFESRPEHVYFSLFSSIPPGKCWDSASVIPRPIPFKSFA